MKVHYENKVSALTAKAKLLRDAGHDRIRQKMTHNKAAVHIQGIRLQPHLTEDIVDGLIERIRVFEDKNITVKFTFSDKEYAYKEVAGDE